MGVMETIAARVAAGTTVQFRPTGTSMVPLIASRALVTVEPVEANRVEVGDIVLAKVAGTVYLHLVSAIDAGNGRVQISNNRGRVNGWTSHARVYGICTAVDGARRPRVDGKICPLRLESERR
jgi:hypothetical protein